MLERYRTQPPARVIAILTQLCAALHEAHQRGFAHGNLKLTNVILCERGGLHDLVKLTDFGVGSPATPRDDLAALGVLARALLGNAGAPILECIASATTAKKLASALRALPIEPWTAAPAWWGEHRRTSAPALPIPATLAVDLAQRRSAASLSSSAGK